jgi:hypothetical protein
MLSNLDMPFAFLVPLLTVIRLTIDFYQPDICLKTVLMLNRKHNITSSSSDPYHNFKMIN